MRESRRAGPSRAGDGVKTIIAGSRGVGSASLVAEAVAAAWFLFYASDPPSNAWTLDQGSESDSGAEATFLVTAEEATFLATTFVDGAKEADLLEWLEGRCLNDEGTIGQAIDACIDAIDSFDSRQTHTILCALLAHFGAEG